MSQVSNGFSIFMNESGVSKEYFQFIQALSEKSALDKKTDELAYISVLSSQGMLGGLPFHVSHAKELGATREEILSAVLVGMPAVGLKVIDALPVALEAFDNSSEEK